MSAHEGYPCSGCGRTIVTDSRCYRCGGRGIRPIPVEWEDDVPSNSYVFSGLVLVFTVAVAVAFVALVIAQAVPS